MDLQQSAPRVLDATRGQTRVKERVYVQVSEWRGGCNNFKGGRGDGCEARSDKEKVGTESAGQDVKEAN